MIARPLLAIALAATPLLSLSEEILGQGEFRYRVVPHWGEAALAKLSIGNGHAMAVDGAGRIIFLTDEAKNNVVILSAEGKLLESWTARMPGAHGLTLTVEQGQELLFITSTTLHEVRKLTLKGEERLHVPWPEASKLYTKADEYKPSKVLLGDRGEFIVFDGYGKDYVHHFDASGKLLKSWGGNLGEGENQLAHFGPHGGAVDRRNPAKPVMLVCMSDKQEVKRFTLDGQFIDKFAMPGGNPRDAVIWNEFLFIPHLGDQWPTDKNAPGFISVLNANNQVISNIGGTAPEFEANGSLKPMQATRPSAFIHPHGMAVDAEGNIYVAQFASKSAPVLKLERVR